MLFIFLFFRFIMAGVESPYQVSIVNFTFGAKSRQVSRYFLFKF